MCAIVTFGVLAVAMGKGEFSLGGVVVSTCSSSPSIGIVRRHRHSDTWAALA